MDAILDRWVPQVVCGSCLVPRMWLTACVCIDGCQPVFSEMIIMDKHMSAGGFKSGLLTAWCALVSSIEEIVLGISGLWGTVTWQDAQVLGNLVGSAWRWFHCGGDGLPDHELRSVSGRLMVSTAVCSDTIRGRDRFVGAVDVAAREADSPSMLIDCAVCRLCWKDLIDLSVKPTNALEVQYNRILDQMGAAGRKQPDLVRHRH